MPGIAAALLSAAALSACSDSSRGSPDQGVTDAAGAACRSSVDCGSGQECRSSACAAFAVCPADIQPMFGSIREGVFARSCGTSGGACHSPAGAPDSGGLDLATDPYSALVGADGRGAPASNFAGSVPDLVRVIPGDPDHSFLVIKLRTTVGADPRYGSGMPFPDPGSVCPETLDAIAGWIRSGAPR